MPAVRVVGGEEPSINIRLITFDRNLAGLGFLKLCNDDHLAVNPRIRGEQIPELVVVPEREGDYVIYAKTGVISAGGLKRATSPDTFKLFDTGRSRLSSVFFSCR